MAISSQGTTFTFSGLTAQITSIQIEEGQGEVVDMTEISDPIRKKRMIASGDIVTPPKVSVDYIRLASTLSPLNMTSISGTLTISHPNASLTCEASIESASTEMSAGDILRGKIVFVLDQT